MAKNSYNMQQKWKVGFFQIIKVQPHAVVSDEDRMPNMVSLNRVIAALEAEREPSRNGAGFGSAKQQNAHDTATKIQRDISKC